MQNSKPFLSKLQTTFFLCKGNEEKRRNMKKQIAFWVISKPYFGLKANQIFSFQIFIIGIIGMWNSKPFLSKQQTTFFLCKGNEEKQRNMKKQIGFWVISKPSLFFAEIYDGGEEKKLFEVEKHTIFWVKNKSFFLFFRELLWELLNTKQQTIFQ